MIDNRVDIMIVGAQKAGTTSLKNYIALHSNICTHPQLEMTYFYSQTEYEQQDIAFRKYFRKKENSHQTINIGKHATLARSEQALINLKNHNSNCKLLYTVREPIRRAFSSYLMEKSNGSISITFNDLVDFALQNPNHWYNNVILGLGKYQNQINLIKQHFPNEQLLVINQNELMTNTKQVMQDVFSYLNLEFNLDDKFETKYNSKSDRENTKMLNKWSRLTWLKNLGIRVLGYEQCLAFAKKVSALFQKEKTVVNESLQDYPESIKKLKKYYEESNNSLFLNYGIDYR